MAFLLFWPYYFDNSVVAISIPTFLGWVWLQLSIFFSNAVATSRFRSTLHFVLYITIPPPQNLVDWAAVNGKAKKSVLAYHSSYPKTGIQWLSHNVTEIRVFAIVLEDDIALKGTTFPAHPLALNKMHAGGGNVSNFTHNIGYLIHGWKDGNYGIRLRHTRTK